MKELISDADFVRETTIQQSDQGAIPDPFGGATVTINGIPGNVTINGGTTGFSFTTAAPNISLTIANAATVRSGLGIDAIATKKSNLGAGADPVVGNDSSQGYGVGSLWTTATKAFIALDVSIGAAVWLQIG